MEQFFERLRNPDSSLRGGWTPYDTPTGFKERLANDLKYLLRDRFDHFESKESAPRTAPAWNGSPYPGLRPFGPEEVAIFFGRGREVDALVARLRDPVPRFLAVVGASGTGKSSVVRAGLMPRLKDGAIKGSQHWPVVLFTPGAYGDNPLLALASKLEPMLPTRTVKSPVEIATALAAAPWTLSDYADAVLADLPIETALMLCIDQFEELFTLAGEKPRQGFIEFLAHTANIPRLRVLATVRADFLPQCAAEPALAAMLQTGTFVLGAPEPGALSNIPQAR